MTQLSATLSGNGAVTVEIFDLLGTRVFQNNLNPLAGRQTMTLPVQNLNNGTYLVRVVNGTQFGVTKLVIAK